MAGLLSSAQMACITAIVTRSLDQSLALERLSSTRTSDAYGHDTTAYQSVGNVSCNVKNPTTSQLQLYAGIIASQRSMVVRALTTTDIREGDRITYDGLKWLVHGIENVDSYTVTRGWLIVTVT